MRLAPPLTIALFLVPVAAGLIGTALPAFGVLPAIGGRALSLDAWRALFAQPGVLTSIRLSVQIGLLATVLSLAIALSFCALMAERAALRRLSAWISPMLATPHVAIAVGFAFLVAPSGWLVRLRVARADRLGPPAGRPRHGARRRRPRDGRRAAAEGGALPRADDAWRR